MTDLDRYIGEELPIIGSGVSRDDVLVALGATLYAIAAADGRVKRKEIHKIMEELTVEAHGHAERLPGILELASSLAKDRTLLRESLETLAEALPPVGRSHVLQVAREVAKVDGAVDAPERKKLVELARALL